MTHRGGARGARAGFEGGAAGRGADAASNILQCHGSRLRASVRLQRATRPPRQSRLSPRSLTQRAAERMDYTALGTVCGRYRTCFLIPITHCTPYTQRSLDCLATPLSVHALTHCISSSFPFFSIPRANIIINIDFTSSKIHSSAILIISFSSSNHRSNNNHSLITMKIKIIFSEYSEFLIVKK